MLVTDTLTSANERVKETQEWKDCSRLNLQSSVSMSLEDVQELVANEVRSDRTREQRLHQENELEFLTIEIDSSPARSIAVVAFIR